MVCTVFDMLLMSCVRGVVTARLRAHLIFLALVFLLWGLHFLLFLWGWWSVILMHAFVLFPLCPLSRFVVSPCWSRFSLFSSVHPVWVRVLPVHRLSGVWSLFVTNNKKIKKGRLVGRGLREPSLSLALGGATMEGLAPRWEVFFSSPGSQDGCGSGCGVGVQFAQEFMCIPPGVTPSVTRFLWAVTVMVPVVPKVKIIMVVLYPCCLRCPASSRCWLDFSRNLMVWLVSEQYPTSTIYTRFWCQGQQAEYQAEVCSI